MDFNKSADDLLKIIGSDEVTDYDISNLRNKIREIEKALEEKDKPKTITISGYSHKTIEDFCNTSKINIGEWASGVLISEVEKLKRVTPSSKDNSYDFRLKYKKIYDCFIKDIDISIDCKIKEDISVEDYLESETKRLKGKYKTDKKILNILRCDTLLSNENLIPIGFSIIDGYALYEICNNIDGVSDTLYNMSLNYSINKMSRVSIEEQIISTSFDDMPFIIFDLNASEII